MLYSACQSGNYLPIFVQRRPSPACTSSTTCTSTALSASLSL